MLSFESFARMARPCTILSFLISGLVLLEFLPANAVSITEHPIPTGGSEPTGITAGPDGNLWFTEQAGNNIGKITAAGVITEYTVPTAIGGPYAITDGSDGNLWFTELSGNNIGKITTVGVITEYAIPTTSSFPYSITAGPDGNLWFTEFYSNKIGKITTAGAITEYPIPTADSEPYGITAGPDDNLWFTEFKGNKIGKITTVGSITEYPVPTAGSGPYDITAGPDGNLWFTELYYGHSTFFYGQNIGQVTIAGVVSEYGIATFNSGPAGIITGPDGNLWLTEENGNKIGRAIVNAGTIPVPTSQQTLPAFQAFAPIISSEPAQAKPIGIGSVAMAGSILSVRTGLDQFSAPVDIYFAISAPALDPVNLFILTPQGLQAIAQAGLVPWLSNTSGNIYVPPVLFLEELSTSLIPPGTYTLYLAVTPTGSLSTYYIWQANFVQGEASQKSEFRVR